MDRSIRTSADPIARPPLGERRRSIRQKLNTPVYASFNGPQTGMVVDLSELLDLNEEGFAVQTTQPLDVNRAVTVCLDLPETKSYIHCSGQVVWSDNAGRGGIRFSALSEKSRQILKEWLFANLMIGYSNHSARSEQLARHNHHEEDSPEDLPPAQAQGSNIIPPSGGSASLSAVEAVRLVIREMGNDLDAILQLIAERALSLTGASGVALALLTDNQTGSKMICRARAGEPAPPLGAPVDIKHGISGQCVRSGLLVSCEDTNNDSRVDPEVCRALNIGSLMAAPIVSDLEVVGLLEVFSPHPRRFTKDHEILLDRLVDLMPVNLVPRTDSEQIAGGSTPIEAPNQPHAQSPTSESTGFASIHTSHEAFLDPPSEAPLSQGFSEQEASEIGPVLLPESAPAASSRFLYRTLLGLAIVMIFVVVGYLIAPVIDKRFAISPQASQRPGGQSAQSAQPPTPQEAYLTDLRRLADLGNPDAEWQLGVRYHNGYGVEKDDAQAMRWFQRAAEQGHVNAQAALGAYYWAGRGVPQDLTKAYFWSAVAFAQGDENSKARLEGMTAQMTREQLSAARQEAAMWIRSHNVPPSPATN
jgi:GAF domain/Sel1 repeat/PilZ domain